MESIVDVIKDADSRKAVVADTVRLISSEVRSKTGLTGLALKAGYSVVSKLKGGRMISHAANLLIEDMSNAIEPLHGRFRKIGEADFSAFLLSNTDEATEALLSVSDAHAEKSDKGLLLKTYKKLRPTAAKHVRAALPGLGQMIDRHTA